MLASHFPSPRSALARLTTYLCTGALLCSVLFLGVRSLLLLFCHIASTLLILNLISKALLDVFVSFPFALMPCAKASELSRSSTSLRFDWTSS